MKLYAKENTTDSEVVDIYYIWNKRRYHFASVLTDNFDSDLQEALVKNEDELYDLELELKLR